MQSASPQPKPQGDPQGTASAALSARGQQKSKAQMAPSEAALNRVLYVLLIIVGYLLLRDPASVRAAAASTLGRQVHRCGPVVAGGVEARVAVRGFGVEIAFAA